VAMKKLRFTLVLVLLVSAVDYCAFSQDTASAATIISFRVDTKEQSLQFFLKDENGENYLSFQNLEEQLAKGGKTLLFAMNGGMYMPDHSPQGLYVENGRELYPLDTAKTGYGNFYMYPNGVFYLTKDNSAVVCRTDEYRYSNNVRFATQSGPMLVVDGKIHHRFVPGSKNLHIRNGVGILPDGSVLFAISKERICFYDFAQFFLQHGCKNALYLDGFVSRAYIPSKNWIQYEGLFGVILGVVE